MALVAYGSHEQAEFSPKFMEKASRWARTFAQRYIVHHPQPGEEVLYEGIVMKKAMLRNKWNRRRVLLTPVGLYFYEEGDNDLPTEVFPLSRVVELWHAGNSGRFEILCQRKFGVGQRKVEFNTSVVRAMSIREGFERALDHMRLESAIELGGSHISHGDKDSESYRS